MATVNSAPTVAVSAYEPAKYIVSSLSTASQIEKIVVNIRSAPAGGGSILATLYKDWIRRTGAGPAYSYQFEVDISGVLQSLLAPTASTRTRQFLLPYIELIDCSTSYIFYYMEFRFLFRDPATNTLSDFGDVEYINTEVRGFNTIRPNKSILQVFKDSLYYVGGGVPLYQKLYNYNTGTAIPIKLSDHYNLVFNTDSFHFMRIDETLANGTTKTTFYKFAQTTIFGRIYALNIGPAYLKAQPSTDYDGGIVPDFTTTVSYSVFMTNNLKFQRTEKLSFQVMPPCQSGLRLAWMNQLAGVDMYTFDARVVTGVEGKSEIGIRPNVWTSATSIALPESRGSYKPFVQRDEYYEVETRIVRAELAEFLSQILTSPEVYIYDDNLAAINPYRSAIIADGSLEVSDTEEIGLILKFKVYPANQTPTHVQ